MAPVLDVANIFFSYVWIVVKFILRFEACVFLFVPFTIMGVAELRGIYLTYVRGTFSTTTNKQMARVLSRFCAAQVSARTTNKRCLKACQQTTVHWRRSLRRLHRQTRGTLLSRRLRRVPCVRMAMPTLHSASPPKPPALPPYRKLCSSQFAYCSCMLSIGYIYLKFRLL